MIKDSAQLAQLANSKKPAFSGLFDVQTMSNQTSR